MVDGEVPAWVTPVGCPLAFPGPKPVFWELTELVGIYQGGMRASPPPWGLGTKMEKKGVGLADLKMRLGKQHHVLTPA